MTPLPQSLQQKCEEMAETHATSIMAYPNDNLISRRHIIHDYTAGFNAAYEVLLQDAPFDEMAALEQGWRYLDDEKDKVCEFVHGAPSRECVTFEQGARWQHTQLSAQLTAHKMEIERLMVAIKEMKDDGFVEAGYCLENIKLRFEVERLRAELKGEK